MPQETGKAPFGQALREGREAAGMSQEELASKLGIGRGMVANYERGAASPDAARAVELARLLNRDPLRFLLLSNVQKVEDRDGSVRQTVDRALAGSEGHTPPPRVRIETHRSLLDFPYAFSPLTVIVGDKREAEPRNAGDLYVFSASTVDDRWLLALGLPRDTEKISDKVFMTALNDESWLRDRFGRSHLLVIGSPASNLFTREYNDHFLFRFAISKEAAHKWRGKREEMRGLKTPAELQYFRQRCEPDLKQTMRLFKQPGFVDLNYSHLKLGIDPAENRDFAVVSIGTNPFAAPGALYFAILAAGVHLPGTAHAVKFLAEPKHFVGHPFGGILEVQVPSDDCVSDAVPWHRKIEQSRADWHQARDLKPAYTPEDLRNAIRDRWGEKVAQGDLVTDVELTQKELDEHLALIDLLGLATATRAVASAIDREGGAV